MKLWDFCCVHNFLWTHLSYSKAYAFSTLPSSSLRNHWTTAIVFDQMGLLTFLAFVLIFPSKEHTGLKDDLDTDVIFLQFFLYNYFVWAANQIIMDLSQIPIYASNVHCCRFVLTYLSIWREKNLLVGILCKCKYAEKMGSGVQEIYWGREHDTGLTSMKGERKKGRMIGLKESPIATC